MRRVEPPLVLVGGGLASAVIAQRLSHIAEPPAILILEAGGEAFSGHTWSFHDADVGAGDMTWLRPLIAHRWNKQSVRFCELRRDLPSGYASLTSASVAAAVAQMSHVELRTKARVDTLFANKVILADGTVEAASCVIDCRGYRSSFAMTLGFQKFVGLEVELRQPHGVVHPVIMDATVDQRDGYRFIYLLPFSDDRLLIEDTRYSDGADLDEQALVDDVNAYAVAHNWFIERIVRQEKGVLPITLAHDFEAFWREAPADIPQAGLRAGLFHPTTGYSLPDAVRLANLVASNWPCTSAELARTIRLHAAACHRRQWFYRLLNRMLFRAARPDQRHLVLQRFYKLPTPLIERFYACRTTYSDMIRICAGKPPVSISRALACLREAPLLRNRHS